MSIVRKLLKDDFSLPCKEMASYLLGKILVRKLDDGTVLKGRIVETEYYPGGEDKASHSYNGRRTLGNEPMYMAAGTTYVYFTYGMYYCFNISSIEPGGAVLIRALEPLEGIDVMKHNRAVKKKGPLKDTELCNGPSKLCISLNITKDTCNRLDLAESDLFWIEDDKVQILATQIVQTKRIGIASAGEEWAGKPYRFYVYSNPNVSKRDKNAENEFV